MPSSPDAQGYEGQTAKDHEDERIPSVGRPAPDQILIQVDVIYQGKTVNKGKDAHCEESFVRDSTFVRQESAHNLSVLANGEYKPSEFGILSRVSQLDWFVR